MKCNENESKNSRNVKKRTQQKLSNVYLNNLLTPLLCFSSLSLSLPHSLCAFVLFFTRSLKSIFKFLDLIFMFTFCVVSFVWLCVCVYVCVSHYLFSKITKEYKNNNNKYVTYVRYF